MKNVRRLYGYAVAATATDTLTERRAVATRSSWTWSNEHECFLKFLFQFQPGRYRSPFRITRVSVLLLLIILVSAVNSFPGHFPRTSRPPVEIKFVDQHVGKPPLVELSFDVVLRNDLAESRWFLLPKSIYRDQAQLTGKGGVDVLEVFAPKGKGRVIIGEFLGTGGFQATLLSAGSEVHLRRFRISFWGDLPDKVPVEVVIAKSLTIGGEPASDWFGLDPTSSAKVDVSELAQDINRQVRTKHTADNKEVPTQVQEDQRLNVSVAINQRQ